MIACSLGQSPRSSSLLQILRPLMSPGGPDDIASIVTPCFSVANALSYHFLLLQSGASSNGFDAASGAFLVGNGIAESIAIDIRDAIFQDACPFIGTYGIFLDSTVAPFNETVCEAFEDNLISYGLSGAVKTALDQAHDLCYMRMFATVDADGQGFVDPSGSGNGTFLPYSLEDVLNGPSLTQTLAILDNYFTPAMLPLDGHYANAGISIVNVQKSYLVEFVLIFLVCYVVFIAVVYLPSIKSVNYDLKKRVCMVSCCTTRTSLLCACSLAAEKDSAYCACTTAGSS